ncbi:MAG: GNAT family N-acetyltransferase [Candidatus Colwellbacteria bacterium]|nr:GNAT family N-acetyltransferase [Candidatus Colwellbacteria bacterium]
MKNNKVSIRRVKEGDLNLLAKLYCEVYDPKRHDVGEKWTEKSAHKLLKYWFDRKNKLDFLAEDDGKIVGAFFTAVKPWWNGNCLYDGEIFVAPDYQGKGVGVQLSKTLYQEAIDKYDAKYFEATTFKDSYSLNWYKKLGFKEPDNLVFISGNLKTILEKLEKENKKRPLGCGQVLYRCRVTTFFSKYAAEVRQ